MPKVHCKHCPIIEFCNLNPILVNRPTGKVKGGTLNPVTGMKTGGKPITIKVRLCPLLLAIGQAVRPPMEEAKK